MVVMLSRLDGQQDLCVCRLIGDKCWSFVRELSVMCEKYVSPTNELNPDSTLEISSFIVVGVKARWRASSPSSLTPARKGKV